MNATTAVGHQDSVAPAITTIRRTYGSWMAFLSAVDEPVAMRVADRASQEDTPSINDWAGGTYAVVRRAAEVSTEVRGRIAPGASMITEHALAAHYDVAGGEVDVGRFLAGEPESMVEYVLQPLTRGGSVLRLQADITQSWVIAAETIRALGNSVVELADGLRARGVGLEIMVTAQWRSATPYYRHETSILVQRPHEPFDVSRLAFAIAHPGMLRRLVFAIMEHEARPARDRLGIRRGQGYGYPSPRRWSETDFYVALTGAKLTDDWTREQADRLV